MAPIRGSRHKAEGNPQGHPYGFVIGGQILRWTVRLWAAGGNKRPLRLPGSIPLRTQGFIVPRFLRNQDSYL